MSYDQGYWHTDYCIEQGFNEDYAGTHIAVYVRWCIENDLLSNDLITEDSDRQQIIIFLIILTGSLESGI